MVELLLMRHGEPDWAAVEGAPWRGAAHDLAPLTSLGREQATAAGVRLAGLAPEDRPAAIVSSPMTRALQTAGIVGRILDLAVGVELDLREWLPDRTYSWTSAHEVAAAYAELIGAGGEPPAAHEVRWESLPEVRARVLAALTPHTDGPLLVVCHEVVIHALTGEQRTSHAQVRRLSAPSA